MSSSGAADNGRKPQTTYSISIQGLSVTSEVRVGPVTVRPTREVMEELGRDLQPSESELFERFEERIAEAHITALAKVVVEDRTEAIGLVRDALDVLRVFQHLEYGITRLSQFGLADDVGGGAIFYTQQRDRTGFSAMYLGHATGWTFTDVGRWNSSALRQVAESIGVETAPEGHVRALRGIRHLSQAIVGRRPESRIIEVVSAIEAWLRPSGSGPQTLQLARTFAFFNCAGCGRDRETCPYLELEPTERSALNRLKALRSHGVDPPWLCSEWHRFMDWYETRSELVHGRGAAVDVKEASSAVFWTYSHVMPNVIAWLTEHPDDPIGDLAAAIEGLPPAPDWEGRLGSWPEA